MCFVHFAGILWIFSRLSLSFPAAWEFRRWWTVSTIFGIHIPIIWELHSRIFCGSAALNDKFIIRLGLFSILIFDLLILSHFEFELSIWALIFFSLGWVYLLLIGWASFANYLVWTNRPCTCCGPRLYLFISY